MKKRKNAQWVCLLIYVLMGVGMGIVYFLAPQREPNAYAYCEMLISLFVCIYMQILVHEAGHLVFGLMTGYRLRMFRIGGMAWLRTGDKIERKRLQLAGTGGQCLMSPPEGSEDDISCGWYLMGGAALNLLSALVALALCAALRLQGLPARLLLTWAIAGIGSALTNGLPLHMALIDNDGCTARAARASRDAKHALLVQLHVNDFLSLGGRIGEVSTECLPEENDPSNPLTAVLAVFCANRLLDAGRLDEARAEIDRLLAADSAIVGLHWHLLACDRMYLALLGDEAERLNALRTPAQLRFMKQMRTNPSVLRTEYAYALLAEKDSARADAWLARFERAAGYHSYPGEIEGERELLALARKKNAQDSESPSAVQVR